MANLLGTDYMPNYSPTQDEKNIALLAHILTLVAPILAPLIIYVIKKNESDFIAYHAKESFNFQIAVIVAGIICFLLIFLVVGIFLIGILGIYATVLIIVATIRASEGRIYEYPFTINLIK
jgi:uncharacterized Tic20 family protein